MLGLARPKPPEPGKTNVIDLGEERIRRFGVMFVGFVTERDAERRRADVEIRTR